MNYHLIEGCRYDSNTGLYKARCVCGAMSSHRDYSTANRGLESHILYHKDK